MQIGAPRLNISLVKLVAAVRASAHNQQVAALVVCGRVKMARHWREETCRALLSLLQDTAGTHYLQ